MKTPAFPKKEAEAVLVVIFISAFRLSNRNRFIFWGWMVFIGGGFFSFSRLRSLSRIHETMRKRENG
jgi:hypothetical protein